MFMKLKEVCCKLQNYIIKIKFEIQIHKIFVFSDFFKIPNEFLKSEKTKMMTCEKDSTTRVLLF